LIFDLDPLLKKKGSSAPANHHFTLFHYFFFNFSLATAVLAMNNCSEHASWEV